MRFSTPTYVLCLSTSDNSPPEISGFANKEDAIRRASQHLGIIDEEETIPYGRLTKRGDPPVDFIEFRRPGDPTLVAWLSVERLRQYDDYSFTGNLRQALEGKREQLSASLEVGELLDVMNILRTEYMDEELAEYARLIIEQYRLTGNAAWQPGSVFLSGSLTPLGGRILGASVVSHVYTRYSAAQGGIHNTRFRRMGSVIGVLLEPAHLDAAEPYLSSGPLRLPYNRQDFSGGVSMDEGAPKLSWYRPAESTGRHSSYCEMSWLPYSYDRLWRVVTFGVCVASKAKAAELCSRLLQLLNYGPGTCQAVSQYLSTGMVLTYSGV